VWCCGHLEWQDLPTEFHNKVLSSSKLSVGDIQVDRQNGDIISLTYLFNERRLKASEFRTQINVLCFQALYINKGQN
jgi:hypothetical protein